MTSIDLLGAFLLGLVSSGHCLGMCGGLMVAAGMQSMRPIYAVSYNMGRLLAYLSLAAVGSVVVIPLPQAVLPLLKLLSTALLVLTALYLANLNGWITKIEALGTPLWRLTSPRARRLLPVSSATTALQLGYFWGFIPCGLVYTALAHSLLQADLIGSLVAMLAFGLGTLPMMISTALAANQMRKLLHYRALRLGLALTMLSLALVSFVSLLGGH